MVDRLEEQHGEELAFVRFDAGEPANQDAVRALRVRGHPLLVLFNAAGEETARYLGPPDEASLREEIARLLEQE